MKKNKEIRLEFVECEREAIDDLSVQELINSCYSNLDNAYAPYSHFSVSAAVLLENGKIITGSNQENAAYPSGLCAERVAIFYANSQYPNQKIMALAVAAKYNGKIIELPIPPCGACRQVLVETENRFKNDIKIILAGFKTVIITDSARLLLPLNFDETFLK